MSNPYPALHHPDCRDQDCRQCMRDADHLSKYLADRMIYNKVDILGKYRKYLDEQGIKSESAFGWILPSAYAESNIEAFLRSWNEEDLDDLEDRTKEEQA